MVPSTREPVLAKDKPSVTWTSEKALEYFMMLKIRKDIEDFHEYRKSYFRFRNYVMNMPYKAADVQKEAEESSNGYISPIKHTKEPENIMDVIKEVADVIAILDEPQKRDNERVFKLLDVVVDDNKKRDEYRREFIRRLPELKSRRGKSYREIERERAEKRNQDMFKKIQNQVRNFQT